MCIHNIIIAPPQVCECNRIFLGCLFSNTGSVLLLSYLARELDSQDIDHKRTHPARLQVMCLWPISVLWGITWPNDRWYTMTDKWVSCQWQVPSLFQTVSKGDFPDGAVKPSGLRFSAPSLYNSPIWPTVHPLKQPLMAPILEPCFAVI